MRRRSFLRLLAELWVVGVIQSFQMILDPYRAVVCRAPPRSIGIICLCSLQVIDALREAPSQMHASLQSVVLFLRSYGPLFGGAAIVVPPATAAAPPSASAASAAAAPATSVPSAAAATTSPRAPTAAEPTPSDLSTSPPSTAPRAPPPGFGAATSGHSPPTAVHPPAPAGVSVVPAGGVPPPSATSSGTTVAAAASAPLAGPLPYPAELAPTPAQQKQFMAVTMACYEEAAKLFTAAHKVYGGAAVRR